MVLLIFNILDKLKNLRLNYCYKNMNKKLENCFSIHFRTLCNFWDQNQVWPLVEGERGGGGDGRALLMERCRYAS